MYTVTEQYIYMLYRKNVCVCVCGGGGGLYVLIVNCKLAGGGLKFVIHIFKFQLDKWMCTYWYL